MGGQSGSWTPTKRRGPIAAEFQGPGPAAIGLPSLFGSKFWYLLIRLESALHSILHSDLFVMSLRVYFSIFLSALKIIFICFSSKDY